MGKVIVVYANSSSLNVHALLASGIICLNFCLSHQLLPNFVCGAVKALVRLCVYTDSIQFRLCIAISTKISSTGSNFEIFCGRKKVVIDGHTGFNVKMELKHRPTGE